MCRKNMFFRGELYKSTKLPPRCAKQPLGQGGGMREKLRNSWSDLLCLEKHVFCLFEESSSRQQNMSTSGGPQAD